jgi:diamine N-acetyltransferase
MEKSLLEQVQNAELEGELKTKLTQLFTELEPLLPALPKRQHRRIEWLLELMFKEITDPAIEVHWWEVGLDLAIKWLAGLGEKSRLAIAAAIQARDHLRGLMGPYTPVRLAEITEDTAPGILLLSETLTEPQRSMVADNAVSIAQGHFSPYAWFRAIHAGKAPVGFLMLYDNAEEPDYFLWRFMIAEPYQGRGYGRQAIDCLLEYVRTRPNAKVLEVSCSQGPGSPEVFYQRLGFIPTGELLGEEVVLKLDLAAPAE